MALSEANDMTIHTNSYATWIRIRIILMCSTYYYGFKVFYESMKPNNMLDK